MITIVKGDEKIVCSRNTYEDQFKHLGYQIASDKKEATKEVASFDKEEEKEDKKDEEIELEEKIEKKYKVSKTKKK